MPSPDIINAGEILLKELCSYFNQEAGYERIEDIMKIRPDDKQELLRFINRKTNNECEYQIRSLDRLIKQVKDRTLLGIIPTRNATLCTLCYVVLQRTNPTLKFDSQTNHGQTHGKPFYASDFTKQFIEPLRSSNSNYSPIPKIFINSCWYLYINVVNNDIPLSKIRKTGRKILKLRKHNESLKAEYFSTNISSADWAGLATYNISKHQLSLSLKTEKNFKRNMTMEFYVPSSFSDEVLEGDISYTTMKELDKEIQTKIFLVKVDCNSALTLKEIAEGEDETISEIENKLRTVKAVTKTILLDHTCHDCSDNVTL